jgi:hypothetical protein
MEKPSGDINISQSHMFHIVTGCQDRLIVAMKTKMDSNFCALHILNADVISVLPRLYEYVVVVVVVVETMQPVYKSIGYANVGYG